MAKLPKLIEKIAKYDPRGVSAVENLTRELRKAGLISRGKRGVGAPNITASDIANTLFGLVCRFSKDAPEAVTRLRQSMQIGVHEDELDPLDLFKGTSVYDNCTDSKGFVRAGPFLDALIDTLANANGSNATLTSLLLGLRIEVFDPFSGFGGLNVLINHGMESETRIRFANYECDRPPVEGIQQAMIIQPEVLLIISLILLEDDQE